MSRRIAMSGFICLVYHEIRKREDFDYSSYKGIEVKDGYQDKLPPHLFVYLDNFKEQMKYLHDNEYNILTLKDVIDFYYNGRELPPKSVLIAFDDLYKSVLLYAYPILREYGFPSVGFVVGNWMFDKAQEDNKDKSVALSLEELDQMRDVFEYANHTYSLHRRRDGQTALQYTGKEEFLRDLEKCEELTTIKGVFAYPFGIFTEENISWIRDEGYLLGFTALGGINTRETDVYRLYRNIVPLEWDLEKFEELIKPLSK